MRRRRLPDQLHRSELGELRAGRRAACLSCCRASRDTGPTRARARLAAMRRGRASPLPRRLQPEGAEPCAPPSAHGERRTRGLPPGPPSRGHRRGPWSCPGARARARRPSRHGCARLSDRSRSSLADARSAARRGVVCCSPTPHPPRPTQARRMACPRPWRGQRRRAGGRRPSGARATLRGQTLGCAMRRGRAWLTGRSRAPATTRAGQAPPTQARRPARASPTRARPARRCRRTG